LLGRGTREAWSTTERRTRGWITLEGWLVPLLCPIPSRWEMQLPSRHGSRGTRTVQHSPSARLIHHLLIRSAG
jgi:hypothetical protein